MNETSCRLYTCVGCFKQITICSYCDRGNIYCTKACSMLHRKSSMKVAGQRYQNTRNGRHHHAQRQSLYKKRKMQNKNLMTHHTSAAPLCCDSLRVTLTNNETDSIKEKCTKSLCCNFCGRACSVFVRQHYFSKKAAKKRKIIGLHPQGP